MRGKLKKKYFIYNINFIEVWDEEVRGTQEEYFQAKQIAVANFSIGTGFG